MSLNSLYIWDAQKYSSSINSLNDAKNTANTLLEKTEDKPSILLYTFSKIIQDKVKSFTGEFRNVPSIKNLYENLHTDLRSHRGAIFRLGLPEEAELQLFVLQTIVDVATGCDLIVLDNNNGMVFLPKGLVFPVEKEKFIKNTMEEIQKNKASFPRTKEDFEKFIHNELNLFLEANQFKRTEMPKPFSENKNGYTRVLDGCTQHFYFSVERLDFEFRLATFLYWCNDQIQDIYNKFNFNYKDDYLFNRTYSDRVGSYNAFLNYKYALEKNYINNFNQVIDIASMNSCFTVNAKSDSNEFSIGVHSFYCPQLAITAKLANDPDFEKKIAEYELIDSWGANQNSRKEAWSKLLKYLRTGIYEKTFFESREEFAIFSESYTDEIAEKFGFVKIAYPVEIKNIKKDGIGYERSCGNGVKQTVAFYFDYRLCAYKIYAYIFLSVDSVTSIYNKFEFENICGAYDYQNTVHNMVFDCYSMNTKLLDDELSIYNNDDFNKAIEWVENCIFVNNLEETKNLSGIDRMLNHGNTNTIWYLNDEFFYPHRLIISKLANSLNFNELLSEFESYKFKYNHVDTNETKWPKLLEYLKNYVS